MRECRWRQTVDSSRERTVHPFRGQSTHLRKRSNARAAAVNTIKGSGRSAPTADSQPSGGHGRQRKGGGRRTKTKEIELITMPTRSKQTLHSDVTEWQGSTAKKRESRTDINFRTFSEVHLAWCSRAAQFREIRLSVKAVPHLVRAKLGILCRIIPSSSHEACYVGRTAERKNDELPSAVAMTIRHGAGKRF